MKAVHRGRWVVVDADTVLSDGYLVVKDGIIVSVGSGRSPQGLPVTDHPGAAICPAFVNAHTHLELSALKGRVPGAGGFEAWVRELLVKRAQFSEQALCVAAEQAVCDAEATGTLVFGDISTLGVTRTLFDKKKAQGVWFQEILGTTPPRTLPDGCGPTSLVSLAAHAPHTTSPATIRRMKVLASAAGRPFCIHLDESDAERDFITTGRGGWADFLTERGIDFSSWPLPAADPVSYLLDLGVVDEQTLVVHLLQSGPGHFKRLAELGAIAVCCVRSNRCLHGRVPAIKAMLDEGLTVALGTDSLASCDSLSILDEMVAVSNHVPGLSAREIFRMATENGARALGLLGRFGRITPGASARCLEVQPPKASQAFSFEWFLQGSGVTPLE